MNSKYLVIPNLRSKSSLIKESSGVEYLCPANTVLTGRWHKGDENGIVYNTLALVKVQ